MESLIVSAKREIEQLRQDIHAGLVGQEADAINWEPYPGGNTIAGLVAHMYDAANFLLRTGLGETVARDREGQFANIAQDGDALLRHIDQSTDNILALAARYTAADLDHEREFRGNPTPGSWFVLHASTHLLEHWGQIQTIRDLRAA